MSIHTANDALAAAFALYGPAGLAQFDPQRQTFIVGFLYEDLAGVTFTRMGEGASWGDAVERAREAQRCIDAGEVKELH